MNKNAAGLQYIDRPEVGLSGIKKIVILGDPGCTGFYAASKNILKHILKQKADLFFILGDLAFTGAEEEFREMIDFCNSRVDVPVFSLCGNHDLSLYSAFLGLRTYALVLDGHVCFFLCNAAGHFLDADIDFLQNTLEKHAGKNFILLMHVPPPTRIGRGSLSEAEWRRLKAVLDPHRSRIRHIFCGHIHGYCEYEADGYPITITAGGGAAMISELSKPARALNHSVIVDLHEDGTLEIELAAILK